MLGRGNVQISEITMLGRGNVQISEFTTPDRGSVQISEFTTLDRGNIQISEFTTQARGNVQISEFTLLGSGNVQIYKIYNIRQRESPDFRIYYARQRREMRIFPILQRSAEKYFPISKFYTLSRRNVRISEFSMPGTEKCQNYNTRQRESPDIQIFCRSLQEFLHFGRKHLAKILL